MPERRRRKTKRTWCKTHLSLYWRCSLYFVNWCPFLFLKELNSFVRISLNTSRQNYKRYLLLSLFDKLCPGLRSMNFICVVFLMICHFLKSQPFKRKWITTRVFTFSLISVAIAKRKMQNINLLRFINILNIRITQILNVFRGKYDIKFYALKSAEICTCVFNYLYTMCPLFGDTQLGVLYLEYSPFLDKTVLSSCGVIMAE
jgi:hypothetical protein